MYRAVVTRVGKNSEKERVQKERGEGYKRGGVSARKSSWDARTVETTRRERQKESERESARERERERK